MASDRLGRRKPLALLGYGLAALSKPRFPLAESVPTVLLARFTERVGKGIRGSAVIAPDGRSLARLAEGTDSGLRLRLPALLPDATLYARPGDCFAGACLVPALVPSRRRRGPVGMSPAGCEARDHGSGTGWESRRAVEKRGEEREAKGALLELIELEQRIEAELAAAEAEAVQIVASAQSEARALDTEDGALEREIDALRDAIARECEEACRRVEAQARAEERRFREVDEETLGRLAQGVVAAVIGGEAGP